MDDYVTARLEAVPTDPMESSSSSQGASDAPIIEGILLKRSRKMHFWNPRFCSIDSQLGIMFWRKQEGDRVPNGMADLREGRISITAEGRVIGDRGLCFVIVDYEGGEHIFCAESIRDYDKWFSALSFMEEKLHGRIIRAYNNEAGADGNGSSMATAPGAPGISGEASPTLDVRGDEQAPSSADLGEGVSPRIGERVILRVCVGGMRSLNTQFLSIDKAKLFFDLKVGSFSRHSKTVSVGNNGPPTWNETFNLAAVAPECPPVTIVALEERKHINRKAPPKMIGSTVISWAHFAPEEVVSFWARLRSGQNESVGEVHLTLQIIQSSSAAAAPPPSKRDANGKLSLQREPSRKQQTGGRRASQTNLLASDLRMLASDNDDDEFEGMSRGDPQQSSPLNAFLDMVLDCFGKPQGKYVASQRFTRLESCDDDL